MTEINELGASAPLDEQEPKRPRRPRWLVAAVTAAALVVVGGGAGAIVWNVREDARYTAALEQWREAIDRLEADLTAAEAVAAGLDNIAAMLNPPPERLDFGGLADWTIWWAANLGAAGERLVSGKVGDVLPDIAQARAEADACDGWVMDVFLVRRTR